MKDLEELGISPAPWSISKRGEIYSQEGFIFGIKRVEFGVLSVFTTDADARLIAAAPKLYERLRRSTNIIEHTVQFVPNADIANHLKKIALENRAALAEAAGEEVNDGK